MCLITIRHVNVVDAESLCKFINQLGSESAYLLYNPGERNCNVEQVKSYLSKVIDSGKSAVYLALDSSNAIVGYVCGEVSNLRRISHIMKMNIGVLKEFHGFGVGRMLADAIINHAEKIGIWRMEATVITSNKLSFNLCKKFGFKVEGIREKSVKIEGDFHDEYLIARFSSNSCS